MAERCAAAAAPDWMDTNADLDEDDAWRGVGWIDPGLPAFRLGDGDRSLSRCSKRLERDESVARAVKGEEAARGDDWSERAGEVGGEAGDEPGEEAYGLETETVTEVQGLSGAVAAATKERDWVEGGDATAKTAADTAAERGSAAGSLGGLVVVPVGYVKGRGVACGERSAGEGSWAEAAHTAAVAAFIAALCTNFSCFSCFWVVIVVGCLRLM